MEAYVRGICSDEFKFLISWRTHWVIENFNKKKFIVSTKNKTPKTPDKLSLKNRSWNYDKTIQN